MTTFVLVAIGGAVGAVSRAIFGHHLNGRLAIGTLVANVIAAFALGYLSRLGQVSSWNEAHSIALKVGLLGALSTWSSLANEVADHLRSDRHSDAATVLALHLILGIGAAWLGLRLGQFG